VLRNCGLFVVSLVIFWLSCVSSAVSMGVQSLRDRNAHRFEVILALSLGGSAESSCFLPALFIAVNKFY